MITRKRMKITRELPEVGTILNGKFKRVMYKAEVVSDPNKPNTKAIKYSGVNYSSMTSAAKAITKQPTNGWRFWKI